MGICSLRLATLKKRTEFQRLRGGSRFACTLFVLETKPRPEAENDDGQPRFGFTITRQIGTAVVRNRIRRRLRAALAALAPSLARPHHDYVLVARTASATCAFSDLKKDLEHALRRVHDPRSTPGRARRA